MSNETLIEEIEDLFDGMLDTIWYTSTETLFEAINRVIEENNND